VLIVLREAKGQGGRDITCYLLVTNCF